jgi:hypothetical protein
MAWSVADAQAVVSTAIGGDNVGEVIQGRERYPVNVRYPRGWVYVDVRGRDLRSVVNDMQGAVARQVAMPAGYAVSWSGQFEYLERATERLKAVVPVTLAVIFVLLYLLFRSFGDAALVMAAVPFSLVGGFWLIWALGHSISVATAVGFIALAGVAAEFGVVMLIYLKNAHARRLADGAPDTEATLLAAIREGAVLRVRPKAMTVAVGDGRSAAHHVGHRHRVGGHDAHRSAHGRRHGDGADPEHARHTGRLVPLASSARRPAAAFCGAGRPAACRPVDPLKELLASRGAGFPGRQRRRARAQWLQAPPCPRRGPLKHANDTGTRLRVRAPHRRAAVRAPARRSANRLRLPRVRVSRSRDSRWHGR